MSGISGHISPLPFAFYDHDASCLRTCAATLLSDSTEFSVTLPVSGSMRSGQLFQQPKLVPVTGGSDYSALLPTPVVNDMGAGKTVQQWDDWTSRMQASHGNGNGHGPSLSIETLRLALLPTPVADNSRGLPSPTTDYQSLANTVQQSSDGPVSSDDHHPNPSPAGDSTPSLWSG